MGAQRSEAPLEAFPLRGTARVTRAIPHHVKYFCKPLTWAFKTPPQPGRFGGALGAFKGRLRGV